LWGSHFDNKSVPPQQPFEKFVVLHGYVGLPVVLHNNPFLQVFTAQVNKVPRAVSLVLQNFHFFDGGKARCLSPQKKLFFRTFVNLPVTDSTFIAGLISQ